MGTDDAGFVVCVDGNPKLTIHFPPTRVSKSLKIGSFPLGELFVTHWFERHKVPVRVTVALLPEIVMAPAARFLADRFTWFKLVNRTLKTA